MPNNHSFLFNHTADHSSNKYNTITHPVNFKGFTKINNLQELILNYGTFKMELNRDKVRASKKSSIKNWIRLVIVSDSRWMWQKRLIWSMNACYIWEIF